MKPIKFKSCFDNKHLGWKGSQQRCLLLTSMGKDILQDALSKIIGQQTLSDLKIIFTDDFDYYPKGLINPREIELDKEMMPVGGSIEYSNKLNNWWLHEKNRKTPTWDLVCKAEIEGCPGLILIEAKAHISELLRKRDKTGAKKDSPNYIKIENALSEVSTAYNYSLSADNHYQLSNRIAWSIKLASMGISVVLLYLGFIDTKEMDDKKSDLIKDLRQWKKIVGDFSEEIGFKNWENRIHGDKMKREDDSINPSFVYPIIRVANVQIDRGELDLTLNID